MFLFVSLLFSFPLVANAKIVTKVVEYKHQDTVMEGFIAYDDSVKGSMPGVLIIHEWTGLGPYVKKRAEQLAAMGYVAFAADIYGKGIRPKPPEAAKVSGSYKNDRPLLRARARAGLEALKENHPKVDAKRIGVMGYCFGGTAALELARSGAELRSAISFHGGLDTPSTEDAKNIKASVLVLHGADDPLVPDAEVKRFEDEMRAANVDWQLVKYSKAVHSFTNPEAGSDPSKGAAYNKTADIRSWEAMKNFFKETLAR